ncbi:MAG TPA: hypothetical protein VL727_29200 [Puia sp.]|nr:hypothetical protein [Puia sp.]
MIQTNDSGQWPKLKKKINVLPLFLLAVLAGNGQTRPQYDTIKIIAEVYQKAKREVGPDGYYRIDSTGQWRFEYAEYWSWDSTEVHTRKVLAWEVWMREMPLCQNCFYTRKMPSLVKTLSFNKLDALCNVLQTWRVEW